MLPHLREFSKEVIELLYAVQSIAIKQCMGLLMVMCCLLAVCRYHVQDIVSSYNDGELLLTHIHNYVLFLSTFMCRR